MGKTDIILPSLMLSVESFGCLVKENSTTFNVLKKFKALVN